jgi:hypothetical protein
MSSRFIHSFSGCFLFIKIISLYTPKIYVHSYQVHSFLNLAALFIITCCFLLFLHRSLYQPNPKRHFLPSLATHYKSHNQCSHPRIIQTWNHTPLHTNLQLEFLCSCLQACLRTRFKFPKFCFEA